MQLNDLDFLQANIQKFYYKTVKHFIKKGVPDNLLAAHVFDAVKASVFSLSAFCFTRTYNYKNGLDEKIDDYTHNLNDYLKKHVQRKLKEDGLA